MAQYSSFFDSTEGDPRSYTADEFAEYFRKFISNGIFNGGSDLEVTTSGNSMVSNISDGFAWLEGYMYKIEGGMSVNHDTADATHSRIDRVVLRLNTSLEVRAIEVKVLTGVPSASPTIPTLTRNNNIYEISLARVLIPANVTSIPVENVTDERLDSSVCGLVGSLITADTNGIFNQFQDWFNTKTPQFQQDWWGWFNTAVAGYDNDWTTWFNAIKSQWTSWHSSQNQNGYVLQSEKGVANGIATLGADGNIVVSQISNVVNAIDRMSYDQYLLWLEIYYSGLTSHIDARGAKAIMMDGFKDSSNSDVNDTLMMDIHKNLVHATTKPFNQFSKNMSGSGVISPTTGSYIGQTFRGVGTLEKIKIYYETNSSYPASRTFELYEGQPTGTDMSGLIRIATGIVTIPASPNGSKVSGFEYFVLPLKVTLDPAKTYLVAASYHDDTWSFDWRKNTEQNLYGNAWNKTSSGSAWTVEGTDTYAMDLIGVGGIGTGFLPFSTDDYRSYQKSLNFTPVEARLYMSVKEPAGTSITPSIRVDDTTYETMTFVGSRPDPKFYGYTEKEYSVKLTKQGQLLKLKFSITPTAESTPELKRYGVIIK